MKRLLMIFSLLVSSYLVAQELEETYVYENFEYNLAFDLTKDWIKDSEEVDSELALNFLSPTKKQLTVSVREIDPELGLDDFVETEIASQQEDGSFSIQDKVLETLMIGDKEMLHMSAVLSFDCFSVKTHAYFYVGDGFGYYWAMFSQNLDVEFQDELLAIVETVRPATQALPVVDEESEIVSEELTREAPVVDIEEELAVQTGMDAEEVSVNIEEEAVEVNEELSLEEPEEMLLDTEVMMQVVVDEPKQDEELSDNPEEVADADEIETQVIAGLEKESSSDDKSDEV